MLLFIQYPFSSHCRTVWSKRHDNMWNSFCLNRYSTCTIGTFKSLHIHFPLNVGLTSYYRLMVRRQWVTGTVWMSPDLNQHHLCYITSVTPTIHCCPLPIAIVPNAPPFTHTPHAFTLDCSANPVMMTMMWSAMWEPASRGMGWHTSMPPAFVMAMCVSEPSSNHDNRRMWPTQSRNSLGLQ